MLKLSQREMAEYYHGGKEMVWQYNTLYQIHYGINSGYSLQFIYRRYKEIGVTKKGRFMAMTAENANKFII